MSLLLSTRRAVVLGVEPYMDKVLSYNPIIYFPMNETAGLTAVNYGTLGTAANGTYTGVTLANATGPDGTNGAPFFDGANDYLDFFSEALDAVFNGNLGTYIVWGRVFNVGIWTDAQYRALISMTADAANNNYIDGIKWNVNNNLSWRHRAQAVTLQRLKVAVNTTDWFCLAYTWNQAGAVKQAYYNGIAEGANLGAGNVYVGSLFVTKTTFGAINTTPNLPWHGWLAHGAVWNTALTPAQILDLATV